MDKRLLLFVISLSAALFVANFYFQSQHEEEVRIWTQAQKAKNAAKLQQLEEQIRQENLPISSFPIYELFLDPEGKSPIGSGFSDGEELIAFQKSVPETVYARKFKSQDRLRPFRAIALELPLAAHAFTTEGRQTIRIGDLPDFGNFKLQLISFSPLKASPASYNDGTFLLLVNEIAELESDPQKRLYFDQNGIVLVKIDEEWLPVGLYDAQERRVIWLEEIPGLETVTISPQGKKVASPTEKAREEFYVLENPYQQLVFSTYGGALKEINLPFQENDDKLSVVKEVEFDREILEKHPQNAYFPDYSFYTPGDKGPVRNARGSLGGFYPLIRRDLIQGEGRKNIRIHPRFYALNIVSEYPEVAELAYEVKSFTKNQIVFQAKQAHRTITKTFTIADEMHGGPYTIDLTIQVEGDARGLWLASGVPEVEWISGAPAPALKYRITKQQKGSVEQLDLPKDATTITSISPDWLANSNGFFGIIMDPLGEGGPGLRANFVSGTQVPSRLVEIDQEYDLYPAEKMPGYVMMLPLKNTPGTTHVRIFAGPLASTILKQVDATYTDKEIGYNPDYIAAQSYHGWFTFISEPFAKFLFFLMRWFYLLTGSWAFSIILLTIALRVMLYPLNNWSFKSTIRMQQIAPEIKSIQEKYKKDPQKAQMEILNLYREKKINPLSGCLPLLIQMPFLIGMFDLLKSTYELRGASFIPGWIDDLSAPDVLFSWQRPVFFFGNEFHLLPFLMGGVMFLQQRLMSPAPANANEMTDQQRQQRAMGNIMTLVFTLMFYNFPSGLNIYFGSSMLLGILQQWWTNRRMQVQTVKK
jgi:YidC/Oxa1 family membrane protein insertase